MIRRRRPRKKFHINKRDLRPENIIFTCVNTLIMLCVIVVMLYPFWNTVAVSFNDAQDTLRGGIKLFPRVFSMYSYQSVFKNKLMLIAAINSVLRTLISTVLGVIIGSMIAYVLSRKRACGKEIYHIIFSCYDVYFSRIDSELFFDEGFKDDKQLCCLCGSRTCKRL